MANTLRINREKKEIVMDRGFAKASEIVGSDEYKKLQVDPEVRPKTANTSSTASGPPSPQGEGCEEEH